MNDYIKFILTHPSSWRWEFRYQLDKFEERIWLWIARRLPKRLAYWSFINSGVSVIKDNEVVPEVEYVTVLQRLPYRNQ